jgi:H3 lysine-79-specific histone-lysine N-methyltransferase
LTPDQAAPFLDAESGIIRQLERAVGIKSLEKFKNALDSYNSTVEGLRSEGILAKNIIGKHNLPSELVDLILKQTYDRIVSPKVAMLRHYQNGTSEIYGELKPKFTRDILSQTQITSDQVFVDLGSGVANVVLQAALEIGCESWGCEIMENPCILAEAQRDEFEARCRLWGLAPGAVKIERGDFRSNVNIREALKRADVVLVNNEVFTPDLNNDLVNLFLDLKDGCRIVSLKSFVPHNHKITSYNLNNPVNLLDVVEKTHSTKSVSWKDTEGNYYIATKDSRRLESYSHLR